MTGAARKSLFMETTKISASRTAGQITELLAKAGARQVLTDYDEQARICGLSFRLPVNSELIPFSLPVRTQALLDILRARRTKARSYTPVADRRRAQADEEQAERIAWRQLLRWIEAQFALIEVGMVEAAEVFLPYLQTAAGETIYTQLKAGGFKALPVPKA